MVRHTAYLVVGILLLSIFSHAQPVGGNVAGTGLAVCVGINKYPLLGDVDSGRERAEALGKKLKAAGYRFVTVLVDGAPQWEKRATLGTIRREITQLAQLARPGDQLVVFFSGRGLMVKGKPHLVPAHGDEDNAIPVQWVVDTLGASLAAGKFLLVDPTSGTEGIVRGLIGTRAPRGVMILRANDPPSAALRVTRPTKPKPGYGKMVVVVHRKLTMKVRGRTREMWRFNKLTLVYTFTFDRDTHAVITTVELPAGEYTVSQLKWEHWEKTWGYFKGGPYAPLPEKLTVKAGAEHELKLLNKQFPGGPHGSSILHWDGRRICRINSITRQVLVGGDIDRELAKELAGLQINTAVIVGNAQRGVKLYAIAAKGYAKALREAREMGNRVLIASVARETAWLLATARDEGFRNARKALVLAEEALQLAEETKVPKVWYYRDALAAALAANAKFDDAARTMKQAVEEGKTAPVLVKPLPHIMKQLEERLALYGSGKAYRDK